MTAHQIRLKRPARGHAAKAMVRIMASFSPLDFARLQAMAAERKVPVAKLMRDVVVAYLKDDRPGAD